MSDKLIWSFGLLVALACAATGAHAQAANNPVPKDEIVRSLRPASGLTRSIVTRKIEVVPGKEAEVLDQHRDLPKINLAIEFAYDSDRPTPAGERQLLQLADALRDPGLQGFRFMLAGHTDARGGDEYNMRLSQRRALAVEDFLVRRAHIDVSRLSAVGFGKTRLLRDVDPDDPRNRRVEVVNLLK
jgi:outer membrane protein OmpA-like peptidoglycan-associated protein